MSWSWSVADRDAKIRQLEQEEQRLDAGTLQRNANAERRMRQIEGQKLRLQSDPPAPGICPDCWFAHGIISELICTHPGTRGVDYWTCRRCGVSVGVKV